MDMVLGNPDRLPCDRLGWRGNACNLLYATSGPQKGCVIAIDAVVQRRPPGIYLAPFMLSNIHIT